MSQLNEELFKSDRAKLTHIETSAAVRVDWVSSSPPEPGDIAVIEDSNESSIQLFHDTKLGGIDWRTLFTLEGPLYAAVHATTATAED